MFFALCSDSSGLFLLMMVVGLILLALPVAVGAGFVRALVKFVGELLTVSRR